MWRIWKYKKLREKKIGKFGEVLRYERPHNSPVVVGSGYCTKEVTYFVHLIIVFALILYVYIYICTAGYAELTVVLLYLHRCF